MDSKLKQIQTNLKLNENTISSILGVLVLVIIGYFVISYVRTTPVQLPSLEKTQELAINDQTPIDLAQQTDLNTTIKQPKQTNPQQLSIVNQINTSPPTTQQPAQAPQPTSTPSPQPTITPIGQIASGVSTERHTESERPPQNYTVQAGDNLWKIAEAQFQTGYAWPEIAAANHIQKPSSLEKGTILIIPNLERAYPATVLGANTEIGGTYDQVQPQTTTLNQDQNTPDSGQTITQYTVTAGDTLWSIAQAYYQNGFAWHTIANANHISHPKTIEIGRVLIIPVK